MRPGTVVRLIHCCVGPILALALYGCATGSEVPDERFVRFFDEMAFGAGVAEPRRERLSRWDGPLRFTVRGDRDFESQASATLSEIGRMAALSVAPSREDGAPLVFHQAPPGTTFPVNRDRADCYIHYRQRNHRIIAADIHIAAADPDRLRLCLYHETFHALGLGHSGVIASVMSAFHEADRPTRWDVMAVRFLMSSALAPDMPRQDVLNALSRLLPRLRDDVDAARSGSGATGRAARLSGRPTARTES